MSDFSVPKVFGHNEELEELAKPIRELCEAVSALQNTINAMAKPVSKKASKAK